MAAPIPSGVPVMITVPGISVMSFDAQQISSALLKIWSAVLESCIVSPFSRDVIRSLSTSPASFGVTIIGPIGQNVSNDLPFTHWLQKRCQCREETSFETAYLQSFKRSINRRHV